MRGSGRGGVEHGKELRIENHNYRGGIMRGLGKWFLDDTETGVYSEEADEHICSCDSHDEQHNFVNALAISCLPEFVEILREALLDSGCDGDLCAHAWHEKTRRLFEEAGLSL
jgi:hypothetical protein